MPERFIGDLFRMGRYTNPLHFLYQFPIPITFATSVSHFCETVMFHWHIFLDLCNLYVRTYTPVLYININK